MNRTANDLYDELNTYGNMVKLTADEIAELDQKYLTLCGMLLDPALTVDAVLVISAEIKKLDWLADEWHAYKSAKKAAAVADAPRPSFFSRIISRIF